MKKPQINKEIIWNWLTQRHLLILRDEDSFAEKLSLNFTYLRFFTVVTAAIILLFSLSLILSNTILSNWFNPVSKEVENQRRLIQLSNVVDSLAVAIQTRDGMLANMNRIMAGNKPLADTIITKNPNKKPQKVDLDELNPADVQLRREFESNHSGRLVSLDKQKNGLKDIVLLSPLPGSIISGKYDAKIGHFGIDLVSKKDEPIKCVADGTVIMSSWTSDTGYVIAVQHSANLISVYKHNSVLLKKAGNVVKAGDIIAIIGNTGELTTGPHLHFELWHNGNPINPELYISL
jgi:murein DD-endopeptidase MepM/ murein hydrolase activator NlpD